MNETDSCIEGKNRNCILIKENCYDITENIEKRSRECSWTVQKCKKKSFYMSEKSAVHANFEQPSTWQIKCTSHHAQKHHIYVVYSYSPDCIYLLKSTGTLCVSLILTTHGNLLFHSIKKASSACVPSATTTTTIDRSTASLYPWEVDVTHPSNDVRNCCHFDIKIAEFWERDVFEWVRELGRIVMSWQFVHGIMMMMMTKRFEWERKSARLVWYVI